MVPRNSGLSLASAGLSHGASESDICLVAAFSFLPRKKTNHRTHTPKQQRFDPFCVPTTDHFERSTFLSHISWYVISPFPLYLLWGRYCFSWK